MDSKLPILKTSVLEKDKAKSKGKATFPKLRAKAGESNGLILFGSLQRQDFLSLEDPVESSVLHCAEQIHICYQHLSKQVFEGHALHAAALKFSSLYVALHQSFQSRGRNLFKVTPKCTSFLR